YGCLACLSRESSSGPQPARRRLRGSAGGYHGSGYHSRQDEKQHQLGVAGIRRLRLTKFAPEIRALTFHLVWPVLALSSLWQRVPWLLPGYPIFPWSGSQICPSPCKTCHVFTLRLGSGCCSTN